MIGGEETLYMGCELLRFSKNSLSFEDKARLEDFTDFDIIMSIMKDRQSPAYKKHIISVELLLTILFSGYTITFEDKEIVLSKDGVVSFINNKNFNSFREILKSIFCLDDNGDTEEYNPKGELAKKIAEKLKAGKARAAALKGTEAKKEIDIFGRYISILSVGLKKNKKDLANYTVYQLFDEIKRYELKDEYDLKIKAKLAGSTNDDKEITNWRKDMYSDKEQN